LEIRVIKKLTAVTTSYWLTSITPPYRGLRSIAFEFTAYKELVRGNKPGYYSEGEGRNKFKGKISQSKLYHSFDFFSNIILAKLRDRLYENA